MGMITGCTAASMTLVVALATCYRCLVELHVAFISMHQGRCLLFNTDLTSVKINLSEQQSICKKLLMSMGKIKNKTVSAF